MGQKREATTKVIEEKDKKKGKKADDFYLAPETPEEKTMPPVASVEYGDDWLQDQYDGQLAVDVYQTPREIIIKSTIAGVKPEDIDIAMNEDVITIRGRRVEDEPVSEDAYFYRECYWGGFSRSIILPTEVKEDKIAATLKNGILTIILPKANKPKARPIRVHEEE